MTRIAICSLAIVTNVLAAQMPRERLVTQLDSIARAAVESRATAGLAVGVVKGGDTLLFKGYGFADLENDVPVTPQTVFRIGSITKQFTSSAIMQLVEEGKIGLDDELTKYVAAWPPRAPRVTVRQLLNHTSGIPSYTDVGEKWFRTIRLDLSHDSLLAIVKDDSLMFDPGSHFYYNNTGYYLLGVILEKVTGRRYGPYLADRFFTPLGLRQTRYCDVAPLIKHRAQGYDRHDGEFSNAEYISMEQPFSAGSLCSTIGDLIAWTRQLSSGRVVSLASYALMTTPVPLTSGRPMSYGFGLGVDSLGSHRRVAHGGGINGFATQLDLYPDDSLIVVVLGNTSSSPSSDVARKLARVVLNVAADRPVADATPVTLSPAERAQFVGTYLLTQQDGTRRRVRIAEGGDGLVWITEPGPQRLPLTSLGVRTFQLPSGVRIRFDVQDGKATGFLYGSGARAREGTRAP